MEVEDVEIGPHVLWISRSGERKHAHIEGKPEHNLVRRAAVALRNPDYLRAGNQIAVGGQERAEPRLVPD